MKRCGRLLGLPATDLSIRVRFRHKRGLRDPAISNLRPTSGLSVSDRLESKQRLRDLSP